MGKKRQKGQKGAKAKKARRPARLDTILWMSFFFFSLLTVVIFALTEMMMLRRAAREETVSNLGEAARETVEGLSSWSSSETAISAYLVAISDEYDVTARIVSADGVLLYPLTVGAEDSAEADYADLVEDMREHSGEIYEVESNVFAYSLSMTLVSDSGEAEVFLYITDLCVIGSAFLVSMLFQTVYIAVILLIVASVLSGAVSMYVSSPIADLTTKAREMSSGKFGIDFKQEKGASYREITDLAESLNYAEGELSKADQMQKELIANVSHDFKTPLTMIKAYASMIQDFSGDIPEKRNQHAQVIIDEADRLAALVNDMLELSKLSAGMDTLKMSLFDLSDYLRQVLTRFEYLSETAGYRFVDDIADGLYVEADRGKIGQVLYNLIGNAVNYTGDDKTVFVRLYGESGTVHLTVTDTGKGIAPEEIDTIWDRYYRSSETHKRPVKGTGLGLSIVKTILTKHGFRFGVRSEVGRGSTFYVDFPAKAAAALPDPEEDPEEDAEKDPGDGPDGAP